MGRPAPAARPLAAAPLDSPSAGLLPWLVRVDADVLAWLEQPPAPDGPPPDPFATSAEADGPIQEQEAGRVGLPVATGAVGVYALARGPWGDPLDLGRLRRVLARLLTVRLPEGDQVLLRLADPTVLPALYRVSTAAELATFFGEAVAALLVVEPLEAIVDVYTRAAAPAWLPRASTFLALS